MRSNASRGGTADSPIIVDIFVEVGSVCLDDVELSNISAAC